MVRPKALKWTYTALLVALGVGFQFRNSLAESADSLALRGYHGLNEMGGGASFFLGVRNATVITTWQGRFDGLYRRSLESQGDFRSSGDFSGQITRSLRRDLDLLAIIQGDYYSFENFTGPTPLQERLIPLPTSLSPTISTGMPSQPLQRIERSLVGIGGAYQPLKSLKLSLVGGQQWERREGFDEKGLSASFTGELKDFVYKGFRNDIEVFLEREELGARLNREGRVILSMEKRFTEQSADHLAVYYRSKAHDYHVINGNSIGTRTDSEQSLMNRLSYDLSPRLGLLVDTEVRGSTHEDQSPAAEATRKEVNTANGFTLQTRGTKTVGWSKLNMDWGMQEDATGLKRERGTSLEGGIAWQMQRMDSLSFQTAVRKRQYDTSDTANYDDRDRLRYEFDLRYWHGFSRYFTISTRTQVTMEHLVYIYGEKSDQNHWNRIFKLSPEVFFIPCCHVANLARFEIVANTTDYDFELDPAFIKSTIYRRYTANDSISWEPSRGWSMSLEYILDLEDGGRFLWNDWIQQLSDQYRTQQLAFVVNRRNQSGININTGLSFYERKGWQYSLQSGQGNVKTPFLYLLRWGPLLQLVYPSSSGLRIEMNGDFSWVHEWNRENYTIVNLELRAVWR